MGALELKDVILEVADDLCDDYKMAECGPCRDEVWESKYIRANYRPPGREGDGFHMPSSRLLLTF